MSDENLQTGEWTRLGRRFSAAELSALLEGAPFLDGLAPEIVAEVAAACELVRVEGDRRVMCRDEPNDSAYAVVHGGLRTIACDARGRDHVIAESYRGDSVGMLGLVQGPRAPVDVWAIRDSILLRLTRDRFQELGACHPELILRLAQGYARKAIGLLGQEADWTTWSRPGAAALNLALVVPSRDREFAREVSALAGAALGRYRRIGRITWRMLDEALGSGASSRLPSEAEDEKVLEFLHSREHGNDVVLYECDAARAPWTERCLRQADRVIAILHAERPDHRAEIREMLELTLQRRQMPQLDVALVHPPHTEVPTGSAADWGRLKGRGRIHHVRMGDRAGYERLARYLVGCGVAVVLSGGGARGIAHLGVLKALEEAQVPVDAIAGTSMGAIMAAGYARGWSAEMLLERVRKLFRRRMALYDPTVPFHSLLAGRKLERVLRSYFDDLDIEDLWLPFFCVSTNLSQAEPRVHDRGTLWHAVAASSSIPGIFPPRREGRDHLVDGGVMDNLPIDVMASRFRGAIIASDVSPHGESAGAEKAASASGRSGSSLLGRLRRHEEERGPGIFDVLVRSTVVGSQHTASASLARGEATLLLSLPVERFKMLEWAAHDELFEAGYRFAKQQLAHWEPP